MAHCVCFHRWRGWWLHGSLQVVLTWISLKFSWTVKIIVLNKRRLDLWFFWCNVLWRSHVIWNTRRLIWWRVWIFWGDGWLISDYFAIRCFLDDIIRLRVIFHVHLMIHFLRLFKIDRKRMNYWLNFSRTHQIRLDSLRTL